VRLRRIYGALYQWGIEGEYNRGFRNEGTLSLDQGYGRSIWVYKELNALR